jgi:hypothetical protein
VAGERPTHPELLDWLAAEFVKRGSSFKAMHRLIMASEAYQMSGETSAANAEKDADNRLWTRFPMRRKTVEEIRDSLLLLDGGLDLAMGGALTSGTGTDNEFSDARKSMHPDDSKRRTVYLPLRRSNLSTLFTLFDFGDATTSTEIREQTNVAPQALYLLNSSFTDKVVAGVAARMAADTGTQPQRIIKMWEQLVGRGITAGERAALGDLWMSLAPPGTTVPDTDVYNVMARAMQPPEALSAVSTAAAEAPAEEATEAAPAMRPRPAAPRRSADGDATQSH